MISKFGLLFNALAMLTFVACTSLIEEGSAPNTSPDSTYPSTALPEHPSDTWVSDPATMVGSDNVILVLQGGPRDFLYFERDGRTLSRYLPGYNDHHVVYLHQSQTLNPAVYARGFDLTIEEARKEVATTTEILRNAVNHFKQKGKHVTVIGHSYGAFIVVDYLARYTSNADQYITTGVRLDVQRALVADNLNGVTAGFAEDGSTYEPFVSKDFSDYSAAERGAYHVRGLLKAAYGEPRYSEMLTLDSLSNATFVSGTSDQQVGRLTDDEIRFLKKKGATVKLVPGGHYDVFLRMIDAVDAGEIPFGR